LQIHLGRRIKKGAIFGTFGNPRRRESCPEEEGIVQVENFGVHLDVTGNCFCGVRMEALIVSTE